MHNMYFNKNNKKIYEINIIICIQKKVEKTQILVMGGKYGVLVETLDRQWKIYNILSYVKLLTYNLRRFIFNRMDLHF